MEPGSAAAAACVRRAAERESSGRHRLTTDGEAQLRAHPRHDRFAGVCSGQHQDHVGHGSFAAGVRGVVHDALTLDPHRRASTAVQVHGVHGAEIAEVAREPDQGHAHRRALPAVDGDQQDVAVRGDADAGPRVAGAEVGAAGVRDVLPVLDQDRHPADRVHHALPSERPLQADVLTLLHLLDRDGAGAAHLGGEHHGAAPHPHGCRQASTAHHGVVAHDADAALAEQHLAGGLEAHRAGVRRRTLGLAPVRREGHDARALRSAACSIRRSRTTGWWRRSCRCRPRVRCRCRRRTRPGRSRSWPRSAGRAPSACRPRRTDAAGGPGKP